MRWRGPGVLAGCLCSCLLMLLTLRPDNLADALLDAKGCNRTVKNSVGWIHWTGRMGRCTIRIKAPLKDSQMIEMKIRRMQVGMLKDSRCEGAYVQFSDELDETDESVGRYCGHVTGNATRLFLRRGPELTVLLDSDSRFAAENPVIFSAQFSVIPARSSESEHQFRPHQFLHPQHHQQPQQRGKPSGSTTPISKTTRSECPLECQMRNDRRTCRLVSPGYPGVYPRGIRCRVGLESSAGRFRIGGSPEDTYDLMNRTSQEPCSSEFCEQEHVQQQQQQLMSADEPLKQRELFDRPGKPRLVDRDEEDEIIIGQGPQLQQQLPSHITSRPKLRGKHQRRRLKSRPRDSDSHSTADNDKPRFGGGDREDLSAKTRHRSFGRQQHQEKSGPGIALFANQEIGEEETKILPRQVDEDILVVDELSKPRKALRGDRLFWSRSRLHESGALRRSSSLDEDDEDDDDDEDGDNEDDNDNDDDDDDDGSRSRRAHHHQYQTSHHNQNHLNHHQPPHHHHHIQTQGHCVGDYLSIQESVNGRLLEIGRFCGEGRLPQIVSRGPSIVLEFHAERDGTIMHSGFHVSIQEAAEAPPEATALLASSSGRSSSSNYDDDDEDEDRSQNQQRYRCDFAFRSSERPKDSVKSARSWYPPRTLCTYRFTGRPNEKVSVILKIVRDERARSAPQSVLQTGSGGGSVVESCPGNEITVYNGTHVSGSFLLWSFCDAHHGDINNIQVPIVSIGNALLIQFYSAIGSFNGQDFTYSITYKFVKKPAANATKRRPAPSDETRVISLRPVDFSALNLSDSDNCNCDFADRIGNFKSWFIVLVVLGVISFVGAIITIIALLLKCAKMRAAEKKLLQTPNRSSYYKGSTD